MGRGRLKAGFVLVLRKLVTSQRRFSALRREGRVATRQNDTTTALCCIDKISSLLGQVLLQLWVFYCSGLIFTSVESPNRS